MLQTEGGDIISVLHIAVMQEILIIFIHQLICSAAIPCIYLSRRRTCFYQSDNLDPLIKYISDKALLSTFVPLQLRYFVAYGRIKLSYTTHNFVTIGEIYRLGLIFRTLRPGRNGRHFDIFKCIFLNETVRISIDISLNFVPYGPIDPNQHWFR